jgi:hypothetical protein
MEKKPCVKRSSPEPPQVEQVLGAVPFLEPEPLHAEQRWERGSLMDTSVPKAASSKPISRLAKVGAA